ncbi:MAG: hypothetical protein WBD90_06970 [Xanthobacteraceae bacterium]
MRLLRRPDLAGLSDDARQHLKHALHFGAGQYSRPALATLAEQFELESTPVVPRDRRSASSARMALDLRISGGVLVIAPAVEAMAAFALEGHKFTAHLGRRLLCLIGGFGQIAGRTLEQSQSQPPCQPAGPSLGAAGIDSRRDPILTRLVDESHRRQYPQHLASPEPEF